MDKVLYLVRHQDCQRGDGIAFNFTRPLSVGDSWLEADLIVYPDGSPARVGDHPYCASCGEPVSVADIDPDNAGDYTVR